MKYVCAGFIKIHFTAYVIICCDLLDSRNCGMIHATVEKKEELLLDSSHDLKLTKE